MRQNGYDCIKNLKMNFDSFYSKEEHYFSQNHSGGMAEYIAKYSVPPCLAIDLGAGEGRNSVFLANLGFNVLAIEPSIAGAKKIVKNSEEHNLKINVENTDFLSCTEKIKDVGFIVALTSLEHMEYNYMLESVNRIKKVLKVGGYVYIMVFTEEDPGFKHEIENASECSAFIQHYFKKNELKDLFSDFEILHYSEYIKEDTDHGPAHYHGKAKLFARKI